MLQRLPVCFLFSFWFMLLLLAQASEGAAARKRDPAMTEPAERDHMPMPRADPAYLQYLERQSMLLQSSEMAKIVSGSELAWCSPAGAGTPEAMLDFADAWLFVHPMTVLTSGRISVFTQLASPSTWTVLRGLGVRGLYIAPIQGGGLLWAKEQRSDIDTGDDVVQYDFSRAVGNEDQYKRLMNDVIDNNVLLGSDLVPAATGLGPDFFLAARNVREYPGIYCMVEIPRELWQHLPEVSGEWGGAALGQAQIDALHKEGLLPKALRDDVSLSGRPGGWAATGGVRGVDGNVYRWVYRFHGSPDFAVLNWEDPSRAAHRILSGSAVRQVGLQGQALLGLRFEAFQGLEAAPEGAETGPLSIEPARTAAQSMSREIRRYGGWSWARNDNLPLHGIGVFLSSGVDYIDDSVFSPGAEHALLTGDASLLRFMADEALRLKIVSRRLVHVMPNQEGISYALPHLNHLASGPGGEKAASFRRGIREVMRAFASRTGSPLARDDYLYATAPGLAALAIGATSLKEAEARTREIEKGHSLLVFFKAMQPGVLMLAGQDLCGALPMQWDGGKVQAPASSRGGYGLTSGAAGLPVTMQGMPRAPQLYPPPDLQAHMNNSFMQRIGAFLRARTRYGVPSGSLTARPATKGRGTIALVTRLPGGKSFLLSVCNFSRERVTEHISLSGVSGLGSALSRVSSLAFGGSHQVSGAQAVTVTLGPWEGCALLLGNTPGNAPEGRHSASQAESVTPIPAAPEMPPAPPERPKAERSFAMPVIVLDAPAPGPAAGVPPVADVPPAAVGVAPAPAAGEPDGGAEQKAPGERKARKRNPRRSAVDPDGW